MALAKKLQKTGGPAPSSETKDTPPVTDTTTPEPSAPPPEPKVKAKVEVKKVVPGAKPVAKAPSNALTAIKSFVLKATGEKTLTENKGPIAAAPSGSTCINDLIGGTLAADKSGPKCPGYPRRHITEIYGAESSGKTTAALQAIAEIQKQGGVAVFLDFEHALDHQYARRIGVSFDEDKLALYQPDTLEKGWQIIHASIAGGADLVVVDSVAAMVPDAELNKKKAGEAPKIGAVAASMAQNLPKVCNWLSTPKYTRNPLGTALIFLNQIRATISTGGGGGKGTSENTAGGYALKFFSYLRIKFTRIRTECLPGKKKDPLTGREVTRPYGNLTQVKLVKSKVDGKQGFTTEIFIRFNHGIDDHYSLIEAGVATKVVGKSGAFYTYEGQKYQGRDRLRRHLMDNPKAFADLRIKILARVRDDAAGIDEDEAETASDDELILFDGGADDSGDTLIAPEEVTIEDLEAATEESSE
jgi:recombination protein RecA